MKKFHLAFLVLMLSIFASEAAVRLPSVITDGMVIQRNEPVKIWGWADSGEEVTVNWKKEKVTTTADESGRWIVTLSPSKAGGPYTMTIGDITINDILVGDVFLCSGQSNMELPVRRVTDMFAEEIASYENSSIRQYAVPQTFNFAAEQEDTPAASWKPCTLENVMNFSALAYFFAKELHRETGIPVGIVNASWGGTPVEAWMSEEALTPFPKYINEKHIYEDEGYRQRIKHLEAENFFHWNTAMDQGDPGLNGQTKWYSAQLDDSGWTEVEMFTKSWGNDGLNPAGGSHWLRKDIDIPSELAGKEAVIRMGCIVDADSVYVNGHFVGNTTYQYPPRIYRIPAGILKEGRNNITVRVISNGGQPSFVPEKPYKIICGDIEVSLEGTWKYRQGAPMPAAPSMMFFYYKPVCLYNAMIHPLRNLRFSGALWYQGESNVERRNEYAALLSGMIQNWRDTFNDPDLPFYIVELAEFLHESDVEGRKAWDEMRAEQAKAAGQNWNAVLIKNKDLGEWNDIHPLDKKTLGQRIAREVLKRMKN
jgi:sialate O-acetylesterase